MSDQRHYITRPTKNEAVLDAAHKAVGQLGIENPGMEISFVAEQIELIAYPDQKHGLIERYDVTVSVNGQTAIIAISASVVKRFNSFGMIAQTIYRSIQHNINEAMYKTVIELLSDRSKDLLIGLLERRVHIVVYSEKLWADDGRGIGSESECREIAAHGLIEVTDPVSMSYALSPDGHHIALTLLKKKRQS